MNYDRIVIGASAGGVEALIEIIKGLPATLPAAVCIVLHVPPESDSMLPAILSRKGTLPVTRALDGEPIHPGHIYVAPPDYHLLIQPGYLHLDHGATENRHRPAVDPLFRTAAAVYRDRVIGVVLSGLLDDGTAGLAVIKSYGGLAVVQDPRSTPFKGMPESAISHVAVDYVLPPEEIAAALIQLTAQPISASADTRLTTVETEIMGPIPSENIPPTQPSEFACPTCGGVLWEQVDGTRTHFRCRVGHAFSPQSLLAEQAEATEAALWAALRALEEQQSLMHRLAERAQGRGHVLSADAFEQQIQQMEQHAALIRQLLQHNWKPAVPGEA